MNVKAAVRQLKQIHNIDVVINQYLHEKNQSLNRIRSNYNVGTVTADVRKVIEYEKKINQAIDSLIDLRADALNRIDCIENNRLKSLLIMRYLRYKSWAYIGIKLGVNPQYARGKLHYNALKSFAEADTKKGKG